MVWPWRLVITPAGDTFTLLRKLYHKLLGPQQSARFRKYQDYESKVLVGNLLDNPEPFLKDTERFALSVIFSAVYGVRLAHLDCPAMLEFYNVWEIMLQCQSKFMQHHKNAMKHFSNREMGQIFNPARFWSIIFRGSKVFQGSFSRG